MNPRNYIISYLDRARMMQLATSVSGQPWCATVYFAHDNSHNLYFVSLPDARHVQELIQNPKIAGTIVLPHNYGDPLDGLQFEGTAREIMDPSEIKLCAESYAERYSRYTLAQDIINKAVPLRLYQVKPVTFVLYDQVHYPTDPRQVWRLEATTDAERV
jgi:uncharacterized protein YhbP (UPF0306 family)